jgi:hypothetical protein
MAGGHKEASIARSLQYVPGSQQRCALSPAERQMMMMRLCSVDSNPSLLYCITWYRAVISRDKRSPAEKHSRKRLYSDVLIHIISADCGCPMESSAPDV